MPRGGKILQAVKTHARGDRLAEHPIVLPDEIQITIPQRSSSRVDPTISVNSNVTESAAMTAVSPPITPASATSPGRVAQAHEEPSVQLTSRIRMLTAARPDTVRIRTADTRQQQNRS